MYCIDDLIAKTDADSMRLTQLPKNTLIENTVLHEAMALRWYQVHEYVLNYNSMKGLQDSILQSMCSF